MIAFEQKNQENFCCRYYWVLAFTHAHGSTRSASAHHLKGDRFKSWSDTIITKDVKMVSTAAISDAQHI